MNMNRKYKAVLFFIFVLFTVLTLKTEAREKIGSYTMSTLRDYNIGDFAITLETDNALWIDVYSTYNPEIKCGIILDERYLPNFITTFENARDLYTEWKKMAIENHLQEIKQKMHFIFFTGGYFSYFDKIKQDDDVKLIFAFTYFKGDYVLIMNLEEMTATDNEKITFNGASIIFNSEAEINSFLDKISPDYINNLKAAKYLNADK
jgi:hypothetical protein